VSIVALIGDIHANLPALEAVLAHARLQNASYIWNIGDFVGYGAFPNEVVNRLRDLDAVSILGNYDRKVLRIVKKQSKWKDKKSAEKLLAFEWAYEQLSTANRKYLQSLPEERFFEFESWAILLTHGSPASREEHLTPETPEERLRELADMTQARIIVHGHSHIPYTRKVDKTWWINTGSVGRPDDGDPRASYAILQLTPQGINVHHFRVHYDLEQAVEGIHRNQLPESFARMILEGRPHDYFQDSDANNQTHG
jgi:putative phosphoesterase